MVSYAELENLRLSKLKTAATQWQEMVDKLTKLADGGGDGGANAADLTTKAKAADWKGDNATVAVTAAWLEGEEDRIAEDATRDYKSAYSARTEQANALAKEWHSANKEWAQERNETYNSLRGVFSVIKGAASDGNDKFEGKTGDQD